VVPILGTYRTVCYKLGVVPILGADRTVCYKSDVVPILGADRTMCYKPDVVPILKNSLRTMTFKVSVEIIVNLGFSFVVGHFPGTSS